MGKKVYISGNTTNCFNEFTLCCTKDFENKFLTNNSSIVDNEEYFYADFKSVENIESCYENRIIKLQDEVIDLQHRLDVAEKAVELACSHIPCKTCPHSNGVNICYVEQDIGHFQSEKDCIADKSYYFKLKAESELKGE